MVSLEWQEHCIVPFNQPSKNFRDKAEIWIPKVLHGNEPRITQRSHHFSKIYKRLQLNHDCIYTIIIY